MVKAFVRSGKGRRRACLGVGPVAGTEQVRGCVAPDHAFGMAAGRDARCGWGVKRSAAMNHAANGTTTVVRAVGTGLIGLAGWRGRIAVTNDGGLQRIGRGDAGSP